MHSHLKSGTKRRSSGSPAKKEKSLTKIPSHKKYPKYDRTALSMSELRVVRYIYSDARVLCDELLRERERERGK